MAQRSWFTAAAGENNIGEITIYDEIGLWGIGSGQFRDALAALGDVSTINLRLNSPGGEIFDGLAIFNMLKRHKAEVIVTVDGIAASIASLVAMAGDQVVMPENAMLMIHNPGGGVWGTADDMRDWADTLDKIRASMVTSYTGKSGKTPEEIIAIMDAETWFTAEEAVAAGFADAVGEPVSAKALFDLTRYRNYVPPAAGTAAVVMPPVVEPAAEAAAAALPAPGGAAEGDPAAAVAAAVAVERERASEIVAACAMRGCPDSAAALIASDKSKDEALAEVASLPRRSPAAASRAVEISARNGAGVAMAEAAPLARAIDAYNASIGGAR